jgi:hypothetical protein
LSKVDTADGFYRIVSNANYVPKLGVVVPTEAGEPQVITFPLVLTMGWMQSPLLFMAATETGADLANQAIQASAPVGPHRLDIVSKSLTSMPEFAPSSTSAPPTLHLPSTPPPEAALDLL